MDVGAGEVRQVLVLVEGLRRSSESASAPQGWVRRRTGWRGSRPGRRVRARQPRQESIAEAVDEGEEVLVC